MPVTTALALPYPAPGDTPDVPYWLQQLAEAVDALGATPTTYVPVWAGSVASAASPAAC